jgi:hypothetical protein
LWFRTPHEDREGQQNCREAEEGDLRHETAD